jgi:prepilin-type processing-associated H-X9-DG protein
VTGLPASWLGAIPSDAAIQTPAQIFSFSEDTIFHSNGEITSANGCLTTYCWKPDARMNFQFLDGHVKTMPVDRVIIRAPWSGVGYDYHWPRAWVSPCVGVADIS